MEKCVFCETEKDKLTTFCGVHICSECLEAETIICSRCNKRIWKEDVYGDNLTRLCDSCYERYNHCFGCRKLIHLNAAYYSKADIELQQYPYCKDCYDNKKS